MADTHKERREAGGQAGGDMESRECRGRWCNRAGAGWECGRRVWWVDGACGDWRWWCGARAIVGSRALVERRRALEIRCAKLPGVSAQAGWGLLG